MKIECPLCGAINYFSGIEESTRFCSNCNAPLTETKIPDNTKNPYIKIKNREASADFSGSKKILNKEIFSDMLVDWVVTNLKIGREKGLYKGFLKSLEEFKVNKVKEDIFYEETIYLYIWLAYTNCINVLQNKNIIDVYFPYFTKKIYNLFSIFSKLEFSGYEEKEWEINLTKKINGYVDAYNLSLDSKNFSFLGGEFYKNLYRKEEFDAITKYLFSIFVVEELKASFKSLGKELTRYKM